MRFLAIEWSVTPQYSFGWGVPLLAAYLFWKRWEDRPTPESIGKNNMLAAAAILAFVFLPLRLMLEANPDWRILLWTDALVLLGSFLLMIRSIGGQPWLKHFVIPIAFLLLAAPWPTRAEKFIIETLTHDIAAATVETLNWIGVPALLRGNIIDLRSASVGVNEACSGIRSVQTILMTALFFGELNRLILVRRIWLVIVALGGTIFFNFIRTILLAWTAATRGVANEAFWHDKIGLFALVASIALTWAISVLFSGKRAVLAEEEPNAITIAPRFLSWRAAATIAIGILSIEAINEIWFRTHESKMGPKIDWTISWPPASTGFVRQNLNDDVLTILRCDRGDSGVWKRTDGSEWTMYFIKWGAGRMAAQLARGHTPDVCMTGNGFRMVADLGSAVLTTPDLSLTFEKYEFTSDGKPWFVFFCLAEDRVMTHNPLAGAKDDYLSALKPHSRLRAVRDGKRFYGQQVFEVAISGYRSAETARAALEKALPDLVKVHAL
ncbi:MAG: exosortase [Verrucomicrobiales bacterium]|nr:exosortase [Verrucomicrobiales bacterium]